MGWFLVVAAATILVFSGNARPYVAPPQLPGRPFSVFGVGIAAALAGLAVISLHRRRSWKRAGRRIGLTPERGGLLGAPELTGSIDGRPVRARTISRQTSSGGESGSSSTTFTVAEADLSGPAEEGLFVAPAGGGGGLGGAARVDLDHAEPSARNDDFVAVGGSEAAGRAVISGAARDALLALDDPSLVAVGNTDAAVADLVDASEADSSLGSFVAGKMEGLIADSISGDASTVTMETKHLVHDGDRLERRLQAVAAVADAFASATAGGADTATASRSAER